MKKQVCKLDSIADVEKCNKKQMMSKYKKYLKM